MGVLLRNAAKWLAPTPLRVFEWGLERLLGKQARLGRRLEELADALEAQRQQTQEGLAAVQAGLAEMKEVQARRHPRAILYNSEYERQAIGAFHEIRRGDDFSRRFLDLVRGLEAESVATVVRILRRQERIQGTEGQAVDLYTPEEQRTLQKIENDRASQILQLGPELYAYRQYLLPVNHFEISVFWDRCGLARVDRIEATYDKDIIDAGGYIGDSALILAPLTRRKVYSFEAVNENYQRMLQTLALNNLQNVVAEKQALGARRGTLSMHVAGACSKVYSAQSRGRYQEEVPVVALDDYVAEHDLDVGLIKVDIEGGEPDFLQGAEQTIRRNRPILLLSIYHNPHDFFGLKPLLESWDLGYRFRIHKPVDFTVSREVLLVGEVR